jgi:hypothetical protein
MQLSVITLWGVAKVFILNVEFKDFPVLLKTKTFRKHPYGVN